MQDAKKEREIASMMAAEAERAIENEKKIQKRKDEQAVVYQQELEKQLEEQEHKKQEEYEQFLKDKLLIDEAVRTIHEEDAREQQMILERQRATQQYIEEFKRKREEWKAEEKRQQEAENAKILAFAELQTTRETGRMQENRVREEKLQKLQEELANKIRMDKEQRNEMERLRQELYLEEQEEKNRQAEIEEMQKLLQQRIELRKAHKEQMEYKAARRAAENAEEDTFRQHMLAKFAHDDRIEQLNADARRRKQMEHRRAVEQLIDERKQCFDTQRQEEVQEHQEQLAREQQIKDIIEEERVRLLQEHASKLRGHMPKGVFRNSKDLDKITDEELRKLYERHEINSDSESD